MIIIIIISVYEYLSSQRLVIYMYTPMNGTVDRIDGFKITFYYYYLHICKYFGP